MSSSNVKAGGVFVEIGADPRKFFAALNKANKALGNMGKSISGAGAKLGGMGIGAVAGLGAAVTQGASLENVLLSIRASSPEAAARIGDIKKAAMDMSQALGRGPAEVAGSMLELVKAGMSVEDVLGGAGKSAIEFATVGQLEVGQAATVMSDAMNVFGVSGAKAVDTLSSAADSSSVSIAEVVEAFSNVGAVGKDANQTIDTMSAAIAILGNNMVKGGDAGTALKSMMLRLTSGADGAAEGLASIGLSMSSFRDDATKQFLPLGQALDVLRGKLENLDPQEKAQALYKIFGSYGLKAATILLNEGSDGFAKMQRAMETADPVARKFETLMSGITGASKQVVAALQRTAIAVSDAVAPAFIDLAKSLLGALNWLASLARDNPQLVQNFAKSAAAAVAFGGAMIGVGSALRVVSFALGGFLQAGRLIASPFILATTTAQTLGKTLTVVGVQMAAFSARGIAAISQFAATATAQLAISAAKSGAVATNYFAGTFSIMAATIARAAEGNFKAAAIGVQAMGKLGATGAKAVLAIAGPAADAAGAVLRIGTTAATVGTTTAGALAVAAGGAMTLTKTATQTTTALALVGTTATTTGTLTLASIGKSIAATLAYTATSISSAGASAAAWAAANVPLLALVGIVGAAAFAFSNLFKVAVELGGWMREGFNASVSDAVKVFEDLKRIGMTTFTAFSDALAAGDMELAMKAAMDGVLAAFTRGANALLSKLDSTMASVLNTLDAYAVYAGNPRLAMEAITGEEAVNPDKLIVELRKRQDARLNKVTEGDVQRNAKATEMEQRVKDTAAIAAAKRADKEIADAASERLSSSKNALDVDLARQMIGGLLDRGNLTGEVEQRLVDEFNKRWEEMSKGPAAAVAAAMPSGMQGVGPEGLAPEAYSLGTGISAAVDMNQLAKFGKQISDLIEGDKLSAEQEQYLLNAYREAQNRIAEQDAMRFGEPRSQAEVAGTFSSVALGGMGFGSNLAEQQLGVLRSIDQKVGNLAGEVAA